MKYFEHWNLKYSFRMNWIGTLTVGINCMVNVRGHSLLIALVLVVGVNRNLAECVVDDLRDSKFP